jgi:predicted NBD/HSP70 family sugar kinase
MPLDAIFVAQEEQQLDPDTNRSIADFDRGLSLKGSNQSAVRDHNEKLILTLLRSAGPKPKAEVARLVGVSTQTASVIMRSLEKRGLIERCAPVRGKVGQPSVPMQLARDGALFFGLKVGRRSSDMVLIDFLGKPIGQKHLTYRYPEPNETLLFAKEVANELSANLEPRQLKKIAGLGLSMPGYLWEWASIIGEPPEKMSAWRDRDIRAEIQELCDYPVYLQNDASCACGAELVFGDHKYSSEMLYFYVGYFVGGGIVLNGSLFTGPTGNAGALAPIRLPSTASGARQLIDVASLSVLEKSVLSSGGNAEHLWDRSMNWNVDPDILNAWIDAAAEGLAYAIVSACAIIDFELVVIDGWLPSSVRAALVEACRRKRAGLDLSGLVQPEIWEGTIGPDARALGAASLPITRQFMTSTSEVAYRFN